MAAGRMSFASKGHDCVIKKLTSIAPPKIAVAACLLIFWTAAPAQARDCVSAYNSIMKQLREYRGYGSAMGNQSDGTKQYWERQLKNCIPNERSRENRAKSQELLARVLRAQGEARVDETVATYRRAISGWSWGTKATRDIEEDIADVFYAHERWSDFVDQSSMLLRRYSSFQSDQRFRAQRGQAYKNLGNEQKAIEEYLTAARLDNGTKKPYEAKEALKLMRSLYRRTSCSILDSFQTDAPNFITKVDDCLRSRRLPTADRVIALRKKGEFYEARKEPEKALQLYKRLIDIQPEPPTYTSLDLANDLFRGVNGSSSVAHKVIGYSIQIGDYSEVEAYAQQFSRDYAQFLDTIAASKSDYNPDDYHQGKTSTERLKAARSVFLMPMVDWLAGANNLAKAIEILDKERQTLLMTENDEIFLTFKKAQLRARAGQYSDAIADYSAVIDYLPANQPETAGTKQTALFERAISYRRLEQISEARNDMDEYFSSYPDDWHLGQITKPMVDAFIFRTELTVRSGDKTATEEHISILKEIFDRFNQPCEPCNTLQALLN